MNASALKAMTAFSLGASAPLTSAEDLEAALRQIGATRYHSLHPFHRLLHASPERKTAEHAGWQIPTDGMEIVL